MQFKREIKVGERICKCIMNEEDLIKLANTFSEKEIYCELGHPFTVGLEPIAAVSRALIIDKDNVAGIITHIEYSHTEQKLTVVIDTHGPMAEEAEEAIADLIPKLRMLTIPGHSSDTGYRPFKFITFDLCHKESISITEDVSDVVSEELRLSN